MNMVMSKHDLKNLSGEINTFFWCVIILLSIDILNSFFFSETAWYTGIETKVGKKLNWMDMCKFFIYFFSIANSMQEQGAKYHCEGHSHSCIKTSPLG
jgi:hypothetical protein